LQDYEMAVKKNAEMEMQDLENDGQKWREGKCAHKVFYKKFLTVMHSPCSRGTHRTKMKFLNQIIVIMSHCYSKAWDRL